MDLLQQTFQKVHSLSGPICSNIILKLKNETKQNKFTIYDLDPEQDLSESSLEK
jgi:hypothetical protein